MARLAKLGIGAVASGAGRGVLPDDHPLCLGCYGATPPVETLFDTVDFMLVVGSHLRGNETRTYNLRLPLSRGRIDADPRADGRSYPTEIFVLGDARLALEGLAARLEKNKPAIDPAFASDIAAAKRAAEAAMRQGASPYGAMIEAVEQQMPRDALWVRDITLAGTGWGGRAPAIRDPRNAVHAMGGGIGQGLPMAVGAALAGGGRKTVALVGDGGLALNLGELATAAESGADIVLLLMNDGGYGVIRNIFDNAYGGRRCFADLKMPDFGMLAESIGIPHRKVGEIGAFAPAFGAALQAKGLSIVEVDMRVIGPFANRGGNFPPPPAGGDRPLEQQLRLDAGDADRQEARLRRRHRILDIDGAAGILEDERGEALPHRVDRGIADAEIEGEAGEEDALQAALAQISREPRLGLAVVLEEGRIGIDVGPEPLADDEGGIRHRQLVVELGAGRALHAVVRPQHLRAVGELHQIVRRGAGMDRGKGLVAVRMPVLRQHHVGEGARQAVDQRHDLVALGHGERAARAEIVLHVHHHQHVGVPDRDRRGHRQILSAESAGDSIMGCKQL